MEEIKMNTIEEEHIEEKPMNSFLKTGKNIALFFIAPFIALIYVIALPIVGFGMIAKLAYETLKERTLKDK